jgi:O-antigen/teichoic acid export membrane protein
MLKRFAANSAFYLLGTVLNRGIAFLLLPVLTYYLTPSDYGILGVCATVSLLFGNLASLCLESAVGVYFPRLGPGEYRRLVGSVWLAQAILPLALVGGLELVGSPLASALWPEVPWDPYLRLAVWAAYFRLAQLVPLALWRTDHRPLRFTAFTVASFTVTTGLVVYFVAVRGEGAEGSLWGQLLGAAAAAVVSHAVVLRRCRPWRQGWFARRHLRAALRLGLPYLPHVTFLWVLNYSDRWLLGAYVPLAEVGIYNVAYTLGMVVHLFGTALTAAYGPLYYQNFANPAFRDRLPRLLAAGVLVSGWVALAISVLAPEVVRVMTQPGYYGAAALVPWLAMGYWFFVAVYQPYLTVIDFSRRTEWTMVITGAPALLNLGLNWLFIPRFGVVAAAVATWIAFLAMAALAAGISRQFDRVPFPWLSAGRLAVVGAVTYAAAASWLTFPSLAAAVLAKAAALAAAGVVMWLASGFHLREMFGLVGLNRRPRTAVG